MVEVWDVDLTAATLSDAACRDLLSPEESSRADRFHFERDRTRFLRRRAARRLWLSEKLGLPESEIRFAENSHGKPCVVGAPAEFQFNTSASGDRALLAAVTSGVVGVDLEQWRPLEPDLEAMISRLAPGERRTLLALSPAERHRRFFECWARKEALVKAAGLGLSLPLDDFEVPLSDPIPVGGGEARWPGDPVPGRRWRVTPMALGEGWSAAVVSDRENPVRVRRFAWQGAESLRSESRL
ncbi:MAG: 4'-phosphopantetheinyl transferase superfamily protein [Verrucomicrobiae bacterium]|nr:4'-phosphopantetheinyl transferase superfamily protein [Verrucomicrobiae bacterium]